jgi:hypothetical protein
LEKYLKGINLKYIIISGEGFVNYVTKSNYLLYDEKNRISRKRFNSLELENLLRTLNLLPTIHFRKLSPKEMKIIK